jgi:transposase
MMRPISKTSKANIIAQANQGRSLRNISNSLQIGYGTVQRTIKDAGISKSNLKPRRPRKLSAANSRHLVRRITSGKDDTTVDLQKFLKQHENKDISTQTIAQTLKEAGLKASLKEKKPLLTAHHRRLRLEFANKYKNWTVEDWKQVIFSDETKVNRLGSDGHLWVWKKPGGPLEDRAISPTVKHGGGSVMVWGCFTAQGVGYLTKIDGNMNGQLYLHILQDELLQTINWYHLDKNGIVFQHDNDPKHKAKIVTKWLKHQQISVLDWPPQSPDLNPIENLWHWFKNRLNSYETQPTSIHELWEHIQDTWETFTAEECIKLIESMPKRIFAVLEAKGGATHF